MIRNRPRNQNSRRRGRPQRPGQTRRLAQLAHESNAVTPFRVQPNRQLLSIPSHSYNLKVRKFFRDKVVVTLPASSFTVSLNNVRDTVRQELGQLQASTYGETFAIHAMRVYCAEPIQQMTVFVSDIEETNTGNSNVVAAFDDVATQSGVSHIACVFPVNNRPTWNRATSDSTLMTVGFVASGLLTQVFFFIDLDITYTRISSVGPSRSVGPITQLLSELSVSEPME